MDGEDGAGDCILSGCSIGSEQALSAFCIVQFSIECECMSIPQKVVSSSNQPGSVSKQPALEMNTSAINLALFLPCLQSN